MTRGSLTRQTVTAFVSAAVFVMLAVVVAVAPVPYVTWAPGQARDVLVDGVGLPLQPLVVLAVWAVLSLAAASRLFRWE